MGCSAEVADALRRLQVDLVWLELRDLSVFESAEAPDIALLDQPHDGADACVEACLSPCRDVGLLVIGDRVPLALEGRHSTAAFVARPIQHDELAFWIRSLAFRLVPSVRRLSKIAARRWRLSPREQRVFELNLRGDFDKEVAQRLGLSVHTVNAYQRSLRRKTGATSKAALYQMLAHGKMPC